MVKFGFFLSADLQLNETPEIIYNTKYESRYQILTYYSYVYVTLNRNILNIALPLPSHRSLSAVHDRKC